MLAGLAAGQNPPPAESGPTIRATATEVLLDLVVRDKRGRPVKNLKPGDVEIYEDGVRQQILSFRLAGGRQVLQAQRQKPAGETRPGPAPRRSLRAVNPVCIVFHNLDPVSRKRATEAVEEFLANDLPPETYVGLFALDDRLKPVYPFTNDRKELMQALQNAFTGRTLDFARASEALLTANPTEMIITTTVDTAAHTATTVARVSGGEVAATTIAGADVSTGEGARAMRGDQVRERGDFSNINGMRETDKIITMIDQLGTLPGRKSVLLISTGLITTGDPDRFQSILTEANRAGLTVYALDIAGLSESSTVGAGNLGLGEVARVSQTQRNIDSNLSEMRNKSRQADNMQDAVRSSDTQASLRELSEGTGGFLIANTNEFRKPFQRIIEDVDSHYEAAYRPVSNKYDGHLRKIEVKLARADLHVESRTGYFAVPDLKGSSPLLPFETAALAILNVRPLPHAFDFRSAAFRFRSDGTNPHTALAFEVPGANLEATPEMGSNTRRLHFSLLALVKDASGQIVDKYSVDAPFEIPAANLPGVRASAVTYTHPAGLPPGHYTVEAAVLDREGRRATTNVIPIDIPEPAKGIGLSSVVLVQRVEDAAGQTDVSDPLVFQGKRVVPWLATTLNPDAKPYIYFVVYPDKSNANKPKIQVEFLVGGQVLAKQTAELPPPDATGAVPMMVAAATRPGNCELKVTALQGTQSAIESVNYAIAAK